MPNRILRVVVLLLLAIWSLPVAGCLSGSSSTSSTPTLDAGLAIQPDAGAPQTTGGDAAPPPPATDAAPPSQPVTIGGTVTGLAGSGLVLTTGAGDTVAVPQAGPFTFPTAIAPGASYSVAVSQQPASPWQTCAVTNAGGVATGDVTSVAVVCTTNTYAVGGTVTGLSSATKAGLVLASALPGGGADTVTVNANGAFVFDQKLPSGASYAITVQASPVSPAQVCSVSGGAGTLTQADVASVVVSCSTSAFTIGGTASGLAGKGLVLANGADTVTISANGTFAFPALVASGGAYQVTVKTQPTSPSQTCSLANASGTVGGAKVTNVAVTCATNAFALGGTVSGLAGSGLVLVDSAGESIAVAASGAFAFKTPIASGAAFTVSVSTQPTNPWQTCTPSVSGTVGNGAVENLAITCATNSYAIGGSVTGLAGAGLVVSLGGGNNVSVAKSGAFTFPAALASGASYAASVVSQPSGPTQSCVVSANGTGKVAGAAITNVAIACATSTFAVGGTIVGLQGTGLVLTDDGGDALTVPAGATSFTFKTPVASGQAFDVAISAQPSSPAQQCGVSGNQGTVVGGPITGVVVNCSTSVFTVGGTVSGLAGSGLALAMGTQSVTVNGDGAFAFPAPIAGGSSYAVTIKTQPASPSQTCAVASGSGVVGGGNVTSVAVTCATNAFTVGGNVSGLAGAGLVLDDNGGSALSIPSSGAFTFGAAIPSGASYDVTIGAQPTNPWQTCAVSNGAGTMGNGAVTNVAVACTTNAYAIGGTVSGLTGSGLAVSLNGGAALPIAAGGAFSFPGTYASGTAYAVAITSSPTGPTQACTIANATGEVAGGAVANVAIRCATTPFAIGGSIAGLSGAGLVLTDEGGDAITIPAGATKIASGAAFDVEVGTQPTSPWQQCTASGNKGTVGGANVTSVVVNCATDTFTIGGSVSGLAGKGLSLQMNGQTLSVTSGAFAFSTPVASGTSYTVSVATPPSGPTQSCSVTSGATGVVGGANVNDVVVTCATNTYAIGGAASGLAGSGLVLLDDGGDALAVTGSSYTFATKVASGAGYAVTVKTQPTSPSQTCTPTATASGVVGAANVTNANVSCVTNAYTVGGTITGLTSPTGVALTLNGGDAITVTGSAFTFTGAPVGSGATYAVAVSGQPVSPSESCTVANGSGTVTTGAITNVAITCKPNPYAISGSISGLQGSGLVLTLNGGDATTIADGATAFSFSTSVASGGAYAVAVATQPTGLSQSCTVSGGSGKVGNGPVTGVVVNCATDTFAISGTISNLTGNNFSITDGVDVLPISSGSTSFAFPTAVASGTGFTVSVTVNPDDGDPDQPVLPYQTCTIANGTGTVTTGPVTNVAITCTTLQEAVSITVTGSDLYNPGTVVTDTVSGNMLNVTASGTFQLETLASGSAYTFSVSNGTSTNWQTCTLNVSSGTVYASAVGVTLQCEALYAITLDATNECNEPINFYDGYESIVIAVGAPAAFNNFLDGRALGQGYQVGFSTANSDSLCACTGQNGKLYGSGTVAGVDYATSDGNRVNVTCGEQIE